MVDLGLWLIIAAFVVWELLAHFVYRNRGPHTLSNRLETLGSAHPWFRWTLRLACLVLAVHLTTPLF